jgi:hypothetical protein
MLLPSPYNDTILTHIYHTSGLPTFIPSATNTEELRTANKFGENTKKSLKRRAKRMSIPINEKGHPKRTKCDMSEKSGGRVTPEMEEMSEKRGGRVTPDRLGNLKKGVGRETREVGDRLAADGQFDVG